MASSEAFASLFSVETPWTVSVVADLSVVSDLGEGGILLVESRSPAADGLLRVFGEVGCMRQSKSELENLG